MNDRELLELAAKAAGLVVFGSSVGRPGVDIIVDGRLRWWSPLTNAGDAMTLVFLTGMDVDLDACRIIYGDDDSEIEWDGSDGKIEHCFRAIVRAAAAIGEAMQ